MKKRIVLVVLLLLILNTVGAQRVINYEKESQGLIHLTDGVDIPKINAGYTLWLPDSRTINGLVIFTHARRDTIKSDSFIDYALLNNLGVLYATTNNRVEFFFKEKKMREIEAYIYEALDEYDIPQEHLLYCGMSLEGTRALKLAIFGQNKKSNYNLKPKAIALCDSPLDMVRFHREMVKSVSTNFKPIATNEGRWVSGYLERNLSGTPQDNYSEYVEYSPYCYRANGGIYLDKFDEIAIRAYTEPDVDWWMETRRKDYYAMNAVDLASMINELVIQGHTRAELIITQDKGYYDDGRRHPHNWNIVDEKDLIDWFVDIIK